MSKCSDNPYIEHGFDRNGSHSEGRYVCECENACIEFDYEQAVILAHTLLNYGHEPSVEDLNDLIKKVSAYKWQLENGEDSE